MRRFFLGMAAGYSGRDIWRHTFAVGFKRDCRNLKKYLRKHYGDGENTRVILCKNGRSALCLALKAYFQPGDAVIVNGFTCYAVYEAVKAAGLVPIWVDINKNDLNYNLKNLEEKIDKNVKGIIIQNSLGNAIDIEKVEELAKKHNLTIIEDLAHCVGVKYADGREVGTVGVAAAFSFGKDKSIDTVSGGAVVLRNPCNDRIQAPNKVPKLSDHLRARFYPLFGRICRGLTGIHLGGVLMRLLLAMHWVERSADNKLDLERKISKVEAKLALRQLRELRRTERNGGRGPIRDYCLVQDRRKVLNRLKQSGYYFDGFWYEKPVSPKRYYRRVDFPETECPNAVFVAEHILNLPTYYSKSELAPAEMIIEAYLLEEEGSKHE